MAAVSERIQVKESMTAAELEGFMMKEGLSEREFADILGMGQLGVHLWLIGDRKISTTNTRLIRLFMKYPKLLREF
jgi:DNA-binding transcriptional regulator YiaG